MDASQIQDLFNKTFTSLPVYNVLICKTYKYSIHFGSVDEYLFKKHILRPEIRTEIVEYISNYYSGPIVYFTGIIERIPELPVYIGVKCRIKYDYICQLFLFNI